MFRYAMIFLSLFALSAQGQESSIYLEDFENSIEDWASADYDSNDISYHATGGHDGGAYISVTDDIDTDVGGFFGGFTALRCADEPSQAPELSCSNGNFTGDWYFSEGVTKLKFWFRHDSNVVGGLIPQVRVSNSFNNPGGSAVFDAVPANTWTELVVEIDPQSPEWDKRWGAAIPDAVAIFRNVARIQPGYYFDPEGSSYSESDVTFDIDDVEILGVTTLEAVVRSKGSIHPHHDGRLGARGIAAFPDDDITVVILGSDTNVGDSSTIDTDNIDASSVRIGRLGGASNTSVFGFNEDNDGLDDAKFISLMTESIGTINDDGSYGGCVASWAEPTTMPVRAELTSGEIIVAEDTTINVNCDAVCH